MPRVSLLFDLDGTISNPLEGIGRSTNYALESLGYKTHPLADLAKYIGPPLDETFKTITGSTDDVEISALIAKYRERYAEVGYAENTLYPGIEAAINALAEHGVLMALCTSKRQDFADKILRMFDLRSKFQFISGGDVGTRKWQQIESLLADKAVGPQALMIGDRAVDLTAAHKNGLGSVGVLWGFGSRAELESESPSHLLTQLSELTKFVS
jgi:phosphoglycolate phosphatase